VARERERRETSKGPGWLEGGVVVAGGGPDVGVRRGGGVKDRKQQRRQRMQCSGYNWVGGCMLYIFLSPSFLGRSLSGET
jgi:hypothetical protein